MGRSAPHQPDCESCQHFLDGYQDLERALPGLTALSSALGSTRGSAGICAVTTRFHNPVPACPDFLPRDAAAGDLPLPDRNITARAAAAPRPARGGHA